MELGHDGVVLAFEMQQSSIMPLPPDDRSGLTAIW